MGREGSSREEYEEHIHMAAGPERGIYRREAKQTRLSLVCKSS